MALLSNYRSRPEPVTLCGNRTKGAAELVGAAGKTCGWKMLARISTPSMSRGGRAAEVGISIHHPHAPILYGRKIFPPGKRWQDTSLLQGPPHIEAAGHKDKHLGRALEDLLPGEAPGGFLGFGQKLLAARHTDQLRDPVTGGEGWVEPLDTADAGSG